MDKAAFRKLEEAVELAISHIVEKGCDDIFRPPVFSDSLEHQIIKSNPEKFREDARKIAIKFIQVADIKKQRIGEIRKTLIAKDQYTFREVSWLDPFDAVKYLTLCILLFEQIERARIPKDLKVVHSHRASENSDELFDKNYGYDSFRSRSGELSREYMGQWKIITDISNFFDRIGNHPLESHLFDIGCDPSHIYLLKEVLLFWAGDRRSFGVPIGSDASRIISEATLIDIDKKLQELKIPFVRYVDDYRIFARSRSEAYLHMQELTSLLAEEGLSVNSKKTRIFKVVDENEIHLDEKSVPGGTHEVIDLDKKIAVRVTRRVSGRSTISKFYKQPGKDALEKIKKYEKESLIEQLANCHPDEEEELIKIAVKYFIYVDSDVDILAQLTKKKITTIFYIVDALIKEAGRLTPETRVAAKKALLDQVDWRNCAYPFKIPLLRLSACEFYSDNSLICQTVDNHRFLDNIIFFKEAITLGANQLNRARVRRLAKELFNTVPACVQRSIFFAVKHHPAVPDDEKRPLLKNMLQGSDDWFIQKM